MSILFPSFIMDFLKSSTFLAIKLILVSFFAIFISTIVTYFFSIILRVPVSMEKRLDFSILNNKLVSEVWTNCLDEHEGNTNKNCILIDKQIYSVIAEINIVKFNSNTDEKYIESELFFNSEFNTKKNFSVKKLSFMTEENHNIQLIYDYIAIIPRMFGYLKSEKLTIVYTNEFDNEKFELEKISLHLNNINLTLDESKIMFIPKISYFELFLGKMYYISLFLVFMSVFSMIFFSYLAVFVYRILTSNPEKSSKASNEDDSKLRDRSSSARKKKLD